MLTVLSISALTSLMPLRNMHVHSNRRLRTLLLLALKLN
jgi:hypothetical protein